MKQSEVETKYEEAVALLRILGSIYDDMDQYKTRKLIIKTNGKTKETISINVMYDLMRVHHTLQRIMIETYGNAKIDTFTKTIESGVCVVNLTI